MFVLIFSCFFAAGCAKLAHLDQLLTLKAYSEEQEALAQQVAEQDARFATLLVAAHEGRLKDYSTDRAVREAFGPPILEKQKDCGAQECRIWLYRYATDMIGSPKVYIYFDKTGRLMDYQLTEATVSQ